MAVPEDPVDPEGGFEVDGGVVVLGGLDPEEVVEPEEGVDPEEAVDPEEDVDPDDPVDPEEGADPEEVFDPEEGVDPDDVVDPEEGLDPEDVVDPEDGLVLVDGGLDVEGAVDPDDGLELELAGGLLDVLPVVAPFPAPDTGVPAAAPSLLLPPHPANAKAHTNERAHSGRTRVRCLSIQHTPNVRVVECRSNTLCRVHTPSRQSRRESQPRQPLQVACRNRTIDRSLTPHPTS